MRLDGRVAAITGAAGGLGLATAHRLATEGCAVAITDIDAGSLEGAASELTAAGARCVAVAGDITDPTTGRALIDEAHAVLGDVTILCNVAGISPPISLEDVAPSDFDRIMHTNCLSQLLCIQQVIPDMRAHGGGAIVNVASVGANVALPKLAVYGASKAAVLGLTRGVAHEFATEGIRCNAICPGGIDTAMAAEVVGSFDDRDAAIAALTGRQLQHRFADPAEIASLIAYLVSDEASFVTGAAVPIDAGHTAW